MKISFYVLSENKAQDSLGFICQLTQTALNKGTQSLLLLTEDKTMLGVLDDALWADEATSFIPHQRLVADDIMTDQTASAGAPVLLGAYLPANFNGIIINLTSRPITDFMTTTNNATPTRVLELIKPDAASMQAGRDNYKHYQQLGYELTHFKV